MLLRFTEPDMLNTELIDSPSGQAKYIILSRASYIQGKDNLIVDVATRVTTITDGRGRVVATVEWAGKEKRSGGIIRIMDKEPVKFADLFDGCDSVNTTPDLLVVPSRLGFVWVATRNSLVVCDGDTDEVIGKYHERSVQLGNTVTPSPVPKVGKSYLEFADFSEDVIVELIVDYIFMNIMRRTRFDLPRYKFPLVDDSVEVRQSIADVLTHVKESFVRRTVGFRRNTL